MRKERKPQRLIMVMLSGRREIAPGHDSRGLVQHLGKLRHERQTHQQLSLSHRIPQGFLHLREVPKRFTQGMGYPQRQETG